jgi:uncharacterized protein with PIN domain
MLGRLANYLRRCGHDTAGAIDPAGEPTRCGRCDGPLRWLLDDARRPGDVPDDQSPVWQCVDCGQLFWKGSHWDRMAETLSEL